MSSNANEESVMPQRGRSTVAKRLASSSSSSPSLSRPRSSTKPPDNAPAEQTPAMPYTGSPSGSRHAIESRTSVVEHQVAPQDASSNPTVNASQSGETTTRAYGRSTTEPESGTSVPLPESHAATTPNTQANEAPSETPDPTQPPASMDAKVQEVAELFFMSSTLDACFKMPAQFSSTSGSDGVVLAAREHSEGNSDGLTDSEKEDPGAVTGPEDDDSEQLDEDEEDDVDPDFEFVKNAPLIMQRFHAHGEVSERVEAEALKLALHGTASRTSTGARRNELGAGVRDGDDDERDDDDDKHKDKDEEEAEEEEEDEDALLQVYYDMLDKLDKLHTEALELEQSIIELTKSSLSSLSDPPPSNKSEGHDRADNDPDNEPSTTQRKQSPRSQIVGVIAACLPVIRARKSNLLMAQELIDSALENLSISLRMESLGLE